MRKFQNNQLQKRYDTDQSFRKKANFKEQQYLDLRKKAEEMKNEQNISDSFIYTYRSKDKDNRVMYFLYGYLQPQPGKHTLAFTLKLINHFKPQVDQRFSVVYFNQHTPSSDYFKQFKNIFFLLPFSIMQRMEAFVLVKPTFYLKAMNYLTITNSAKIFDKCYHNVDSSQQLCDKLKIPVQDFVSFVPEEYSTQFPSKFKRDVSLDNYRVNLYGQNLTESMRFQKKEFQKTVNYQIQKQVYRLQNYQIGDLGVPVVLQMLIFYFTSHPDGLCVQGIFRKSVATDQVEKTLAKLSKKNYQHIQTISNPHLVASLIKKFFDNLKEPIIPFHLFTQLMDDQKITDKREHLKIIISKLAKLNFITLVFLIDFLKKEVISRQTQNKMSGSNIAVCFSPCLMKSEVSSMADLIYASKSVSYSILLINQFDYIFGNQEQRSNLFKSNLNQQNDIFQQTIREELNFDQPGQDQLKKGDLLKKLSESRKQKGDLQKKLKIFEETIEQLKNKLIVLFEQNERHKQKALDQQKKLSDVKGQLIRHEQTNKQNQEKIKKLQTLLNEQDTKYQEQIQVLNKKIQQFSQLDQLQLFVRRYINDLSLFQNSVGKVNLQLQQFYKDPYLIFFTLLVQSEKLNSPFFNKITKINLDLSYFYQQLKARKAPFNKWQEIIKEEIKKKVKSFR